MVILVNYGLRTSPEKVSSPPRRMAGVFVVIMLAAVVMLNVISSSRRSLCKTFFGHKTWGDVWEDIYHEETDYPGTGPRAARVNDPNAVGYFLTLTHCPGDNYATGVDTHDPGHNFYDAAALLKYSIISNTYPKGSKYNATMYAIVHPEAIRCTDPKGNTYDRVAVLKELGYHVQILGNPIVPYDLDPSVKNGIDTDAGNRNMMPLHLLDFTGHPVAVGVDFTTLMLQPMDDIYDKFIASGDKIALTMDYPDALPATGSNCGINTHWVMFKPSTDTKTELLNLYATTTFSGASGWNNQDIKGFSGEYGMKGFFAHYASHVNSAAVGILPRCKFGNDNHAPTGVDANGKSVCYDPLDCQDCRDTSMREVKVIKMIESCGAPWDCSFDDNWDDKTKATCESFHREWFERRATFEKDCWLDAPPVKRDGNYKPDVFMGYCSCPEASCYEPMIHDNPTPDTNGTPSTSPSMSPTDTPKYPPKVTSSGQAETVNYVASTVVNPSFETKGATFPGENSFMIIHEDNLLGWETTSSDQKVEVWHGGFLRKEGQYGREPDDGEYYIELNAYEPAALWQAVDTKGVRTLSIDFAHGQRVWSTEQIAVWIGSTPPPDKANPTEIIDWNAHGFVPVLETSSDSVKGWHQYQGNFHIPVDQDTTYAVFETMSGLASSGNFMDDVKLRGVNSVSLEAFDVRLSDRDDTDLVEAKITLTNAEPDDTLGLGGILPVGLTSTTTVANSAIEIHITGSASVVDYQSIVNGIGFSSSSQIAGTRVIAIMVGDGDLESNSDNVSVTYIV